MTEDPPPVPPTTTTTTATVTTTTPSVALTPDTTLPTDTDAGAGPEALAESAPESGEAVTESVGVTVSSTSTLIEQLESVGLLGLGEITSGTSYILILFFDPYSSSFPHLILPLHSLTQYTTEPILSMNDDVILSAMRESNSPPTVTDLGSMILESENIVTSVEIPSIPIGEEGSGSGPGSGSISVPLSNTDSSMNVSNIPVVDTHVSSVTIPGEQSSALDLGSLDFSALLGLDLNPPVTTTTTAITTAPVTTTASAVEQSSTVSVPAEIVPDVMPAAVDTPAPDSNPIESTTAVTDTVAVTDVEEEEAGLYSTSSTFSDSSSIPNESQLQLEFGAEEVDNETSGGGSGTDIPADTQNENDTVVPTDTNTEAQVEVEVEVHRIACPPGYESDVFYSLPEFMQLEILDQHEEENGSEQVRALVEVSEWREFHLLSL